MSDSSAGSTPALDPATAGELLARARLARANAYAPYSSFPVGAALLARDGRIFTGVNVENASYGMTTCAERSALAHAVTEGAREFLAIAVAGPDDARPCPPCGSCRQILHELAPELAVVTGGEAGLSVDSLAALLPSAFGPRSLDAKR
jgi:cytidine deaminase